MKRRTRIAVLMTCFNRKSKTLSCLESLFKQEQKDFFNLHVFLVDDGCTDGTADAVKKTYPEVDILQGTGDLYWNGGMRLAFGEAMKGDFDYYLWLNNDVLLYSDTIARLLDIVQSLHTAQGRPAIIVGAMKDPETGKLTYSGNRIKGWYAPLSYERVEPREVPMLCDAINGNCVLIPATVARRVGNLNEKFTHGAGDYDYSLRAKKMGFSSYVAPGYAGTCSQNTITGTCRDKTLSFAERKKILERPTALPSAKEWMYFARCHAGILWPFYWLRTSLRVFAPSLWLLVHGKSN